MTIRSTAAVSVLVLGSCGLVLAQGGRVPGPPVVDVTTHLAPAKTTLITSPVDGGQYDCRMVNVGKAPIAITKDTIKIFNMDGVLISNGERVDKNGCPASLLPGMGCGAITSSLVDPQLPDDPRSYDEAYCEISFTGSADNVRGSLQGRLNNGAAGEGLVVEAR
jgi:hypothetical protein